MKLRLSGMTWLVCIVLGLTLLYPSAAAASYASVYSGEDGIDDDYWVDFTNDRLIYNGGSNIYFGKTDGPGLSIVWYKCSDRSNGGPNGPYGGKYYSDPDPTGVSMLDYNFLPNTYFCLSVLSNGANDKDEFSGKLYWNVYSNPEA